MKKKKLAICNILNFNGSWSLESVKVNFNLIQRRKWMKYETLAIYNTVSVILVCCLGLLFIFFLLTVCFCDQDVARHAFPFPFCFCAVTAEAKYIFCTHNSLICKTFICKTIISPTLYSHMYATYVRSSYAKLSRSIGHSLWFDYQMPLYLCVPL